MWRIKIFIWIYRPLNFFGILAAVLTALGIGFFVSVFADYLQSGLVIYLYYPALPGKTVQ